MRQHRFFIGQDLGGVWDRAVTLGGDGNSPIVFDFLPESVGGDVSDTGEVGGGITAIFSSEVQRKSIISHHIDLINQWKRVFRYTAGSSVILFDGMGEFEAEILKIDTEAVKFRLIRQIRDKNSAVQIGQGRVGQVGQKIWLALSVLKGEHVDMVVEKTTELGVSGIILCDSDRVIKKGANIDRLQKIAIESAEQCGRIDVPVVAGVISLQTLLGLSEGKNGGEKTLTGVDFLPKFDQKIVLNMEGENIMKVVEKIGSDSSDKNILLFVGPEGGWSDDEVENFQNDKSLKTVLLGNTVLRAETAAIIGVGAFYLR